MYFFWGKEEHRYKWLAGLVVATFNSPEMKIANVVFTGSSNEILYPVPRLLYSPPPEQMACMTNAFRNKITTLLPVNTAMEVQLDPLSSAVTCIRKKGPNAANQFPAAKQANDEWTMEVDVAISGEVPRRAFVSSGAIPGLVVDIDPGIHLDTFDSDKPYGGTLKLVVDQAMVERLANAGIREFVERQQKLKNTDGKSCCFSLTLINICPAANPEPAVVHNAPWNEAKQRMPLISIDDDEPPDNVSDEQKQQQA